MTGVIAGISVKAIAGSLFGKAASGVKGVGKWLGSLDLVHMLLLVLVIFGAYQTGGRWIQHRHTAKVEAQLTSAAKVILSLDSQLATARANETALKKAIADQNAAIADLGATSAKQQDQATKALQTAKERAAAAQATSDRLTASSRSAPLKSAPACEPSDALKGQWKP